MPVANGRHYLAIPGPSVVPDAVLQAMHRPAPNIYTGELVEMTHALVPDLKKIARTTGHLAMYISNGHGLWEASLTNFLSRGDKVLVCVTGTFGSGWADVAEALGADVARLDFGKQSPVDPDALREILAADTSKDIKAVLTVHVDTATSVRNDIAAIREAIDAEGHPALLAVDCIASLGCDRFEMDAWGVDVMIAASQKGLMTPPGMGFVWFSDKAASVGASADMRTPYWDWETRANPSALYEYFDGTPPTHHLYGLRAAVDMILEEGIENVWTRHEILAGTYWAAIQAWGKGGKLRCNIAERENRSHAVTTLSLSAPEATQLREWLSEHMGITLGIPLGMADWEDPEWHGHFRIGHMGHINAHMVLGLIGSIETAFIALGIPHGTGGTAAAAAYLAEQGGMVPQAVPQEAGTCCG
ncbi:pyridoxal-phosphate-dependent aminotransferase family protein [Celeribacter arenosi]|uniref:Aminotransferase class V-fold PLP-dependent enzyme n=1 Tax=Celeribacter arenosi TaxID=792649 RepID=A0ABP7K9N6_9RHOB